MAKKKVAEEVVEEVKAAEEVVEEKPKTKRTRAKKTEEPVVEETPVEEVKEEPKVEEAPVVEETPVVEEAPVVEEVKEEKPKKSKKAEKVEEPVEEKVEETAVECGNGIIKIPSQDEFTPYFAVVTSGTLAILKGAALTHNKAGELRKGTRVKIFEISGNFGRIGADKWININFTEKI